MAHPGKRILQSRDGLYNSVDGDKRDHKFYVINRPQSSLWEIKREGGGPLPFSLQGLYTSELAAYKLIKKHTVGL